MYLQPGRSSPGVWCLVSGCVDICHRWLAGCCAHLCHFRFTTTWRERESSQHLVSQYKVHGVAGYLGTYLHVPKAKDVLTAKAVRSGTNDSKPRTQVPYSPDPLL